MSAAELDRHRSASRVDALLRRAELDRCDSGRFHTVVKNLRNAGISRSPAGGRWGRRNSRLAQSNRADGSNYLVGPGVRRTQRCGLGPVDRRKPTLLAIEPCPLAISLDVRHWSRGAMKCRTAYVMR